MKATEIINKAKHDIRDFIVYELKRLYIAKGWGDRDYNPFGDMEYEIDGSLTMDVWVTDAEGNDYTEKRGIERLVCGDNTFFVELKDDREYYFSELDINVLAEIACMIEGVYNNAIKED